MFVDDEDRLWVSTFPEEAGETPNEWWVLNSNGAMLGQLHLSEHQLLREIKDGMAYTLESEEAFGEQVVVRYRIELTEI